MISYSSTTGSTDCVQTYTFNNTTCTQSITIIYPHQNNNVSLPYNTEEAHNDTELVPLPIIKRMWPLAIHMSKPINRLAHDMIRFPQKHAGHRDGIGIKNWSKRK